MNWYFKVIRTCEFSGRARRKEFWMFHLVHTLVTFGNAALVYMVAYMVDSPKARTFMLWAYGMYCATTVLQAIAVGVRRMHDTNSEGWWLFLPIFGWFLAAAPGDEGPNKYGEDPKAPPEE
jgi:uncharacterized membrane protein YhaH (DUF805 family)